MIIDDLDVEGIPFVPSEAYSPSFIDANAVPARPVTFQSFEAVAGRRHQVLQTPCTVQIEQFSPRRSFDRLESRNRQVLEKALGFLALEGLNHNRNLLL